MHSRIWSGAALAALAMLAACAPRPLPPAPVPAPPPQPVPAPPPLAPPPTLAWQDGPLTTGDWTYDPQTRPRAAFAQQGPLFVVECTDDRRIRFARIGSAVPAPGLTIRTTFGERTLPAAGEGPATSAMLTSSDPLLDEIAFSRGRFLVHVDGMPDLVLPAWPEPARVIEDCRG
jgi:hypothetical protein